MVEERSSVSEGNVVVRLVVLVFLFFFYTFVIV